MAKAKKVHIMGIGGSAASGIAQIAQAQGFEVSGCDREADTPYLAKAAHAGIPIAVGHDPAHLQQADIVAVSPALIFQNPDHPEVQAARQSGKLMTWQEFLGRFLHARKFVICVAGTHGKSTTTAMAGLVLEAAGLDPTVEIGATVPAWHNNIRLGRSRYFISEADEFNDNFLHYHPDIIILNNIEMDHPEYFQTESRLLRSFQSFIDQLKPGGALIYNTDSPLIHKLSLPPNAISYSLADFPQSLKLGVPGYHNQSNALGILNLARLLNIPDDLTAQSLSSFTGIARRIEFLGEASGIKVYDDYANHPTAFAASIAGVAELNPGARILAVIEPHTYSRLRAVLSDLPKSVVQAAQVIVTRIFPSREADPGDFTGADIVSALHHPIAQYIPEFSDVVAYIENHKSDFDVILVMGSGNSHLLSRQILASLG